MKDKFKETLSNILSYLLKVERRTLLWSNPSNIYGTGTVALDLSDYDEVEILAAGFQTSNYVYSRCPIGKDGLIQVFTTSPDNASNAYTFMNTASRHYTVTQTGITFNNGQMTYAGSAYQNWNSRAVPLKIYGIKSGGVLRKSVIAVLSAILKIGGGVDEGNVRRTACEDTHKTADAVNTIHHNEDDRCWLSVRLLCKQIGIRLAEWCRNKGLDCRTNTVERSCNRNCFRYKCYTDLCGAIQQLHISTDGHSISPCLVRSVALSERGCAV